MKFLATVIAFSVSFAVQAKVMNPGEAKGQLVYLSVEDVLTNSPKLRGLNPLSIPVFAELPMELAVVAGAVTLRQQNLLSHVQIKSRARGTPNLDLSDVPGGLESDLMKPFRDGDYAHLVCASDGMVRLEKSTREEAIAFHESRRRPTVHLEADLTERRVRRGSELRWKDYTSVGSKAANYAELARVLNTSRRKLVRPNLAIPFRYYREYIDGNPEIADAIDRVLRDPLMRRVADIQYREKKLQALRELMEEPSNGVDRGLVETLLERFEPRTKMKLRSSTNAEDLPDFNGAGLYESTGYNPMRDGRERAREEKIAELEKSLRQVWASVWTLRAYEERSAFGIPHDQVQMGIQVNPSYTDEKADGVVVTRNIADRADLPGAGVYIEVQRGNRHSVANPEPGVRPERILVRYDRKFPLNSRSYRIDLLQRSNVADDGITVLDRDNPKRVLVDEHVRDLVYQSLRATAHFSRILGRGRPDFALDLEFKLDASETGRERIYLKQARPYVN